MPAVDVTNYHLLWTLENSILRNVLITQTHHLAHVIFRKSKNIKFQ